MAVVTITTGSGATLEASGASSLAGGFVKATSKLLSADHGDYPVGKFVLEFTLGSAPGAGAHVGLYIRPLNINGGNDAPVPSANYDHPDAYFQVPNASGTHTLMCRAPLDPDAEVYVSSRGFDLPSGWPLAYVAETEDIS